MSAIVDRGVDGPPPSTPTIQIDAPIFGQSGYDFAARFLIGGLIEQGFEVTLSTSVSDPTVRVIG